MYHDLIHTKVNISLQRYHCKVRDYDEETESLSAENLSVFVSQITKEMKDKGRKVSCLHNLTCDVTVKE